QNVTTVTTSARGAGEHSNSPETRTSPTITTSPTPTSAKNHLSDVKEHEVVLPVQQ
ncbi:unnamed protein product, partial [Amoebophrya sp. A120]